MPKTKTQFSTFILGTILSVLIVFGSNPSSAHCYEKYRDACNWKVCCGMAVAGVTGLFATGHPVGMLVAGVGGACVKQCSTVCEVMTFLMQANKMATSISYNYSGDHDLLDPLVEQYVRDVKRTPKYRLSNIEWSQAQKEVAQIIDNASRSNSFCQSEEETSWPNLSTIYKDFLDGTFASDFQDNNS